MDDARARADPPDLRAVDTVAMDCARDTARGGLVVLSNTLFMSMALAARNARLSSVCVCVCVCMCVCTEREFGKRKKDDEGQQKTHEGLYLVVDTRLFEEGFTHDLSTLNVPGPGVSSRLAGVNPEQRKRTCQ